MIVAFEGWNDAGEAATSAVRIVRDAMPLVPLLEMDPELYIDYQFNRPVVGLDEHGERSITWPGATLYGPARRQRARGVVPEVLPEESRIDRNNLFVLLGTEPSPKATLALLERLEGVLDISVPRGDLDEEASAWESGIDALANEDEDMAAYIEQLEKARDTVDSPEASGEAIAREFERYLRRGEGGPGRSPDDPPPWRPSS